jgi:hypothetical protein
MNTLHKHRSAIVALLLLLLSWIVPVSCKSGKTGSEKLFVGTAHAVINPACGDYIAGDKQNRKFSGVHDSLYIKVVLVSDEKNSIAILTADCIGLISPEILEIREAVSDMISSNEFYPSHIVLTSTHTHSGPDVVGLWGPDQLSSGVNQGYLNHLIRTASGKIIEAYRNRMPVEAFYGETTHGDNWVYNIAVPEETDRSVAILQFRDMNGKSIATLTNFACHPTFMDAASDLVSADFVAGFYEKLDSELGGINMFLQGAIGGWVQPENEEKTFENASNKGNGLADCVLQALDDEKNLEGTDIIFRRKEFRMPVSNPGFQQLAAMGVIEREITDSVLTEIDWFEIGNAQFVTHPGETSPEYSLDSKKLMLKSGPKFVLGLGNDGLGYIVKPEFFDSTFNLPHSGYLTGMSVDRNAGPLMMKIIGQLADEQKEQENHR